jgi:hypothetical protein
MFFFEWYKKRVLKRPATPVSFVGKRISDTVRNS